MERQDPSYGVVVHTSVLRVQALLGEVTTLHVGARRRSTGLCAYELQGCEPFTLRRGGGLYRVCQTPSALSYAGF